LFGGVAGPDLSLYSFYDDFNRANNATVPGTPLKGANWVVIVPQFGIVGNTLQCTNANDGSMAQGGTLGAGGVECDITSSDWVTHSPGLWIKGTDANNYIRWICQSGNSGLTSVIAGATNTLGGGGATPANGASMKVKLTLVANVFRAFYNDVQVFTTTLTGAEAAMAGTGCGVRFGGGVQSGGVFDNYKVYL
jgi:hypothetical protein